MDKIYFDNKEFIKTSFNGYYVCKEGFILSVKVKGGQGRLDYSNPRYHSVKIDKDGYCEVCLSYMQDGKTKRVYRRLHRLIWEAFNGRIPKEMTIDHIDNNKQNNNIANLQLMTRADNTIKANKRRVGEKRVVDKNKIYKLIINDELIGVFTYGELVKSYKISPYYLSEIKNGNYPKKLKDKNIIIERVERTSKG